MLPVHLVGRALARPDGAVEEACPLVGGFRSRPMDTVDGLTQPRPVRRPRTGRHRCRRPARREILCAPTVIEVVDRFERRIAEQCREAGQCAVAPVGRGQRVERPRVGEPQQDAGAVVTGADVEGDEDRTFVGQRLTRAAVGAPERRLVGGIGLAQVALRPVLGELAVLGRQVRQERDARPVFGWNRDDDRLRRDRALDPT